MERHLIEKKPTWWLLYTLGAALVGSIWLIETSVPSDAARLSLELAAVATISVLMLGWLRVNRGRIELAETLVARRDAVEPTAQNGSPRPALHTSSRMWLELRPEVGAAIRSAPPPHAPSGT